MTIKDILIEKQPNEYLKLIRLKRSLSPQPISEKEIRECMKHDAWKRGKGGAIRQVRW